MGIGDYGVQKRVAEATALNDKERRISVMMLVMASIHLAMSEEAKIVRVNGGHADLHVGYERHGVWTVLIAVDGRVGRADWPVDSQKDFLKLSLPTRGAKSEHLVQIDFDSPHTTAQVAIKMIQDAFSRVSLPPVL